jgi:hypothetical protein
MNKRATNVITAALSESKKARGVFPNIVDRRAFFDKIVLSVWGKKRDLPENIRKIVNLPIGGADRNYARAERGVLTTSGNPYEMRYGPMRLQSTLPPIMLTLRSERRPTTVRSTVVAIESLCEEVSKATVSQVELTFDLSGVSVEWLRNRVFTRARRFRRLRDQDGRRTLYIGGRQTPWQVRIYDKASDVVRLEFILRRQFLRRLGINNPADLRRLRDANLTRLIRIRRLNRPALREFAGNLNWIRRRVLGDWIRDFTLREFATSAQECGWKLPPELLPRSVIDRRLENMLGRLVV